MNNINTYITLIDEYIKKSLPVCDNALSDIPEMLSYSLQSGGKRIRPVLCLMFCKTLGGNINEALPLACAVEFIHTYSLIHDDLPCMDNDDFRRGKLSAHKKFGEANALLTGDALLTHSFHIISNAALNGEISAEKAVKAVNVLSGLAGAQGMIGGQYIDLLYENRNADTETLFMMDRLKTAALIESACVMGVIAADGDETAQKKASEFAISFGLAFQITDDILELSDEVSSDEKNGKSTYVTKLGFQKSMEKASEYTEKAVKALEFFGESAKEIVDLSHELLSRKK